MKVRPLSSMLTLPLTRSSWLSGRQFLPSPYQPGLQEQQNPAVLSSQLALDHHGSVFFQIV